MRMRVALAILLAMAAIPIVSMQTASAQDGAVYAVSYALRARDGDDALAAVGEREPQGCGQHALRHPAAHGPLQPVRDRGGLAGCAVMDEDAIVVLAADEMMEFKFRQ